MVGFGKTGTGEYGDINCDGVKRAAQNLITEIDNKRLLLADFQNSVPTGPVSLDFDRALPLGGLIAPGDSGGGLFITTPTGTYLAGVNSFVGSDLGAVRSTYGNFSGHTRVSAFRDWIEANIHSDSEATESRMAQSKSNDQKQPEMKFYPVPEPGSIVLLLAAGTMLWLSRRLLRRP